MAAKTVKNTKQKSKNSNRKYRLWRNNSQRLIRHYNMWAGTLEVRFK